MQLRRQQLTRWGRLTHICVDKLTIIGSDNGLSPGRRQAIIWTNVRILLIRPLGTKFQWNVNRNSYNFIQENPFKNVVCEMASILSRPQWVKIVHRQKWSRMSMFYLLFIPSSNAIYVIELCMCVFVCVIACKWSCTLCSPSTVSSMIRTIGYVFISKQHYVLMWFIFRS